MLLLNAQKCLLSFSLCFPKSVSKALYWFCMSFLFFCVKQHTLFERTVVAAYDLKNCTMVHPISSPTAVTATLHIWPYSWTRINGHSKKEKIKILMKNDSLMMVESIHFWPALSDSWSWKLIFGIFESGRFKQYFFCILISQNMS